MANVLVMILAVAAAIFMARRGVPGLFCSLGFAHQDRGDYSGAERWFLKALTFEKYIQKCTRQGKGLAIVCSNLGLLYHHARRMDQAASMFREAIRVYSDLGFPRSQLQSLPPSGNSNSTEEISRRQRRRPTKHLNSTSVVPMLGRPSLPQQHYLV